MKTKTEVYHFRVHTVNLLEEIVNCALPKNAGVLFIPLNTFKSLLAQVAQRCTEINDPILDKLMFDLTLYELPIPSSEEYNKLMKKVYARAKREQKKQLIK
jgi:hypothetical protein